MCAALQNINSGKQLIPSEEFTLIEDQDSLEEIMIYDMVVEYQGIVQYDEDMSEIRLRADDKSTSEIILGNVSQNPRVESKEDIFESTTLSHMVVSHEEEILAQSFGEPSDEELDEWTKVSNNRTDDEQ